MATHPTIDIDIKKLDNDEQVYVDKYMMKMNSAILASREQLKSVDSKIYTCDLMHEVC